MGGGVKNPEAMGKTAPRGLREKKREERTENVKTSKEERFQEQTSHLFLNRKPGSPRWLKEEK